MKAYLHIGSHKTGTTALQSFALANRDWLAGRGLLYPGYDLIGGARSRSHLNMMAALSEDRVMPETSDPVRLLRAARQAAEERRCNLLFSAESLFRFGPAKIGKVCAALNELEGMKIVVVCSLRPLSQFTESLYRNGYRKYTRRPPEFPAWLAQSESKLDYATIISSYVDRLVADRILLPYSSRTRDGFVHRFFAALGIAGTQEAVAPVRQMNPSFDTVDCLAKRLLMGNRPDEPLSQAFNDFIFRNRISTGYVFLDRTYEAQFRELSGRNNDELIGFEPAMASVLGPGSDALDGDPIDASCMALAEERAASFRKASMTPGFSARTSRGRKGAGRNCRGGSRPPVATG